MKIALIGYGKMGKAIEAIARQRGHEIGLIISTANLTGLTKENLAPCDVAIEFTNPQSAVINMQACFNAGIPVVCGSTGWKLSDIADANKNISLLYASNFSVGATIFFALNKKLALLMASHPEYKVAVEEIHHTAKKDAPSGTAISLANEIIAARRELTHWVNNESEEPAALPIISIRTDPAPGTHHVKYVSGIDDIEIIHTAHNRTGFATGAVLAAEFLKGKKGIYKMDDVLGI